LRVDDLDEWERHFHETSVPHMPRKSRPDGASQLFLRDPDGHVIELFTPPPPSNDRTPSVESPAPTLL
jgi:hypothetical protein